MPRPINKVVEMPLAVRAMGVPDEIWESLPGLDRLRYIRWVAGQSAVEATKHNGSSSGNRILFQPEFDPDSDQEKVHVFREINGRNTKIPGLIKAGYIDYSGHPDHNGDKEIQYGNPSRKFPILALDVVGLVKPKARSIIPLERVFEGLAWPMDQHSLLVPNDTKPFTLVEKITLITGVPGRIIRITPQVPES